jgi:hypothetical protein
MDQSNLLQPRLNRIQQWSLIIGGIGLVISLVGAFVSREQFFQSYLFGYLFWISIALGCFAATMLHHVAGGAWSFTIRRLAESGAMTLLLMAALFIPILLGVNQLYLWAQPAHVAESELLQHKVPYLNVPFFAVRAVLYFVIWIGIAYLLNKWSAEQDKTAEPGLAQRLRALSAPGLILYVLTATFASFDWMMSLEPEWFSSIYGLIFIGGQMLVAMAFAIILTVSLAQYQPLSNWISANIYNDLGNFLLAFVAFWAYIAFSQFLIIWSGNLPEEITWYLVRTQGGWQWLALVLILFHFVVPFFLLLARWSKRRVRILTTIAALLFVMQLVALFWLIMPAFYPQGFHLHWLDLVTPVGIGGLWLAFFVWQLKKKSLLPLHDSRLQEVPAHD